LVTITVDRRDGARGRSPAWNLHAAGIFLVMHRSMAKHNRGFTLIEAALEVVIVIVAVAIPPPCRSRQRHRRASVSGSAEPVAAWDVYTTRRRFTRSVAFG